MPAWTSQELDEIGAAEELRLASVRRDSTLRKAVTVWVVRCSDDLYVRSVHGRTSSWFRGAQARHEARIETDGVEKDVILVETDGPSDEIDTAYRAKYHRQPKRFVDDIVSSAARTATLRLVPR